MTIDDIRPAIGCYYRHRTTGERALLRRCHSATRPDGSPNGSIARLVGDGGAEWVMDVPDFWQGWIHDDLYDPNRN